MAVREVVCLDQAPSRARRARIIVRVVLGERAGVGARGVWDVGVDDDDLCEGVLRTYTILEVSRGRSGVAVMIFSFRRSMFPRRLKIRTLSSVQSVSNDSLIHPIHQVHNHKNASLIPSNQNIKLSHVNSIFISIRFPYTH